MLQAAAAQQTSPQKLIFGVFAHPDDEAFGPAGTLLKEVSEGADLQLILLTAGEAGVNPDGFANLATQRLAEWHRAGQLLGTSQQLFLGYADGQLNNQSMLEVSDRLISHVQTELQKHASYTAVEFIAFDLCGVTGHIDHIVASRASCLAFYKLQPNYPAIQRLRLFCAPNNHVHTDWVFQQACQCDKDQTEVIDARQLQPEIKQLMSTYVSQRADAQKRLAQAGTNLGLEHFRILS